jgi:energy-coupling factor transporter ATP-binding protein EcfA2
MITIDSVTRTYGASAAVDDASWTARPGWVTGFLGPNGAGKSTIVRILVGLARAATSGTSTVSGRSHVNLPNPGREDGVLLDAPAQHAVRTGREILTIALPDRGWHTRELAVRHRAGALAGLMVVVASLTGCIASDVEVIGALGVTVDEEQRPVVVVEASKGTATGVHLSFDRKV